MRSLNYSEKENYSQDYENSNFFEEEEEQKVFKEAFEEAFKCDLQGNNININENLFDEKMNPNSNSTQIFSNLENVKINQSSTSCNNLLGKKAERNNKKFKTYKINEKREITLIAFNSKFNKYLTEKVNKIILENCQLSQFYFTDENPLLSTKFTQCGIQKKLKNYLLSSLKEFIKKENFEKICDIGLEKYYLFHSPLFELIFEYYEYIYNNKKEFNKYLLDSKFAIRNKKFSKDGLINLNYQENFKKVYGYLEFFKIKINKKYNKEKNKVLRFSVIQRNEFY